MGAKITFDFTGGKIVIEGSEAELVNILQEAKGLAPKLTEIVIRSEPFRAHPPRQDDAKDTTTMPAHVRKSAVREFGKSLPSTNTYERIAILAYHAIKIDGKASFSPKEMEDWFGLCGFKKPANMRVALADAKSKYGYVGKKGRGEWTLTTGGENLVMEKLESQGNKHV